MTDNPDNEGFNLEEESFDNFEKKKGTLGDMWRNKPLFKVGVVVAAAAVIFGTIILFGGGSDQKPQVSMVPAGSEVTAAPGTQEASQVYVDAVKEENEARTEIAEKEGTSSIPTPIEPPVGRVAVPEEETTQDPLQRWRALQQERLERELKKTQPLKTENLPPEEDANRKEEVQRLAQNMTAQMQSILESRNQTKVFHREITSPDVLETLKKAEEQKAAAAAAAANQEVNIQEIIMPAGQIAFAQLITEANSDAPGPVLAQIAGGPLNGARIMGTFAVQRELLTLNFNTIIIDGISDSISAVAIDPGTTLPAMATDVDHHYLTRVALPMAAAFIEGLANAVSESGLTTVSISADSGTSTSSTNGDTSTEQQVASGIDEAGQKLGEIIDETADDIKVTVRIQAGTPMGILFMKPVIKKNNQSTYNTNTDSQVAGSAGNL